MSARKEADLKPVDRVHVFVALPEGDLKQSLSQNAAQLAKEARAETITVVTELPSETLLSKELEIGEASVRIALVRVV